MWPTYSAEKLSSHGCPALLPCCCYTCLTHQPCLQDSSCRPAAASILHQAIAAAVVNLPQQQLAARLPKQQQQQQDQLPLPVDLAAAAAAALAGADCPPRSHTRTHKQQQQQQGDVSAAVASGSLVAAAFAAGVGGKPVWLCLSRLLLQLLGQLPVVPAATDGSNTHAVTGSGSREEASAAASLALVAAGDGCDGCGVAETP